MNSGAGHLAEGSTVGPYRIVRPIGGGGMGVVYEATEEALGRRVALKLIAPHLADDPGFRHRFVREARALAALDSAYVVQVHAHGEADGRLYLATQLVPDGDLGQMLLQHGPPPARIALDLVAQVAAGLADAHAAGLVHRDIKPANVLLRRRGSTLSAYLGDFGIARAVGAEHTRTGTAGTPAFMAPELHTGADAGVASDVYSAGCLLWTVLTGRPPYVAATDYQLVTAHLGQPVPQLAGASPVVDEVNRILRAAMAKDPRDRYASAADLRADLLRARRRTDAGTSFVAAAGEPGSVRAPAPRRTAVAAAAVVAVVLVGGGVALAALAGDEASRPSGSDRPDRPAASGSARPDRAAATANLARALADQGVLTPRQSRCVARRWLADVGLAAMVDAGFFDEDLAWVDQDRSAMTPGIEQAAGTAAAACAGR